MSIVITYGIWILTFVCLCTDNFLPQLLQTLLTILMQILCSYDMSYIITFNIWEVRIISLYFFPLQVKSRGKRGCQKFTGLWCSIRKVRKTSNARRKAEKRNSCNQLIKKCQKSWREKRNIYCNNIECMCVKSKKNSTSDFKFSVFSNSLIVTCYD